VLILEKTPGDLKVTEVPLPTPKEDEYFIEVRAAGANFFDLLQIRGKYQWVCGLLESLKS
jgi:NADPH2:quinone reductase